MSFAKEPTRESAKAAAMLRTYLAEPLLVISIFPFWPN